MTRPFGSLFRMKMKEVWLGCWSRVLPLQQANEQIELVPLSPLDNCMLTVTYPRKVLLFEQAGADAPSILKQSLAKALVHFHPFAGRVSFLVPDLKLQLHCNNLGAAFVEATTSATVAELGSEVLPSEFTDQLCQMEIQPKYPWREDYPLLSIQVTRFSCGGLSLGVAFSHHITDGVGFWYFMNSWAEIARVGELSLTPELRYEIEEGSLPDELPLTLVTTPRKPMVQALKSIMDRQVQKDSFETTLVNLSKAKLTELKSLVPHPGCTTFAVTCAYFWQRIARTWETNGNEDTAKLIVMVNCRERTSWLSSRYFGNATIGTSLTIAVEQLRTASVASIARLIHQRIQESCTEKSIEDAIRVLHAYDGNEETMVFPGGTDCTRMTMIVGSPRHRIYEVDFGWGRVCNSTFGSCDLGLNKLSLYPSPREDGAVDAILSLDPSSMGLFLEQL